MIGGRELEGSLLFSVFKRFFFAYLYLESKDGIIINTINRIILAVGPPSSITPSPPDSALKFVITSYPDILSENVIINYTILPLLRQASAL